MPAGGNPAIGVWSAGDDAGERRESNDSAANLRLLLEEVAGAVASTSPTSEQQQQLSALAPPAGAGAARASQDGGAHGGNMIWRDPIRGGQKRIAVIRSLGLSPDEEAKMLGMSNDPIIVDLFCTIYGGDSGSPDQLQHFKIALQAALEYTAGTVGESNLERLTEIDDAVDEARKEWLEEKKGLERAAWERAKEECDTEWQRKWDNRERRIEKRQQRAKDEQTAALRQRERALCRAVLLLEQQVAAAVSEVTGFMDSKAAEAGAAPRDFSVERHAPPRSAGPIDPAVGMEPEEEDEVDCELALPVPDAEAHIEDCEQQLRSCVQEMNRVAGVDLAGIVEVHQEEVQKLADDVDAAAAELQRCEQELAEVTEELETLKNMKSVMFDASCMTDLRGSHIDAQAKLLDEARQLAAESEAAKIRAESQIAEAEQARKEELRRRKAAEQQFANFIARVERGRDAWEEACPEVSMVLTDFVGRVAPPVASALPDGRIPESELKVPIPVPPPKIKYKVRKSSNRPDALDDHGDTSASSESEAEAVVRTLLPGDPMRCTGLTVTSRATGGKFYDDALDGGGRCTTPVGCYHRHLPRSADAAPRRRPAPGFAGAWAAAGARHAPSALRRPTVDRMHTVDRAILVRELAIPARPPPGGAGSVAPYIDRGSRPLALTWSPQSPQRGATPGWPPPIHHTPLPG